MCVGGVGWDKYMCVLGGGVGYVHVCVGGWGGISTCVCVGGWWDRYVHVCVCMSANQSVQLKQSIQLVHVPLSSWHNAVLGTQLDKSVLL